MKKINRFIFWTPRILSIVFILFLMLFSFDIFGMGFGFWETIKGLFIHNIPALILLITLIISWKYEIVGGIIFNLAGLGYSFLILNSILKGPFEWYMLFYPLIIAVPAFIIGVLFLINWVRRRS